MGRKPKYEREETPTWNFWWRELNQADRDVFGLAFVLGRMSSTQACHYLRRKRSQATVERSLKKLTELGLLIRFRTLANSGEGTRPYVYQITKRGARIGHASYWTYRHFSFDYKAPTFYTMHLKHRLAVNDAVIRILEHDNVDKYCGRLGFQLRSCAVANNATERLRIRPDGVEEQEYLTIRPDAHLLGRRRDEDSRFGLPVVGSRTKPSISIYLEIDRGTKSIYKLRRQMDTYVGAYSCNEWFEKPFDFPLVCWVFRKPDIGNQFIRILARLYEDPRHAWVKSSRSPRTEIEVESELPNLFMCVTSEHLFKSTSSVTKDNIWWTHDMKRPYTLEEVIEKRAAASEVAYIEYIKREQMFNRMLSRKRGAA